MTFDSLPPVVLPGLTTSGATVAPLEAASAAELGTLEVVSPVVMPGLTTSGVGLISPLVSTDAVALNISLAAMWVGHGAPGIIVGSRLNDEYVDLDTGDVYELS